jgi:ADP-heptose:LPS heptosyltransferase
MKTKLLVVELWGLGDLAIAAPFLKAASEQFEVTLLAKPFARDLAAHFFPDVRVFPFVAPWTAFHQKYRVLSWPWKELFKLGTLAAESIEIGASGRWDPRDHFLLQLLGLSRRFGFPRWGSQALLTDPLPIPDHYAHRYESWRRLGEALGLNLATRNQIPWVPKPNVDFTLIHSGAGQKLRVWPLERYQALVTHLRRGGECVRIGCDPDQAGWWRSQGETEVAVPQSVGELVSLLGHARAFIGNDSGPGHVAALTGVPTFTLFGPQLPQWFAPLHPAGEYVEGSPCPYRPCFDYCRFESPRCLLDLQQDHVIARVEQFLAKLAATRPAFAVDSP